MLHSEAHALEWTFDARVWAAKGTHADRLTVERALDGTVRASLDGLVVPGLGELGTYRLTCLQSTVPCREGGLERFRGDSGQGADLRWNRSRDALRLFVVGADRPRVGLVRTESAWVFEFEDFELADWIGSSGGDLLLQSAVIQGRASLSEGGGEFDLQLSGLDFDTTDGRIAGAALALDVDGQWRGSTLEGAVDWRSGEALFGPLYLPSPQAPIRLEFRHGTAEPGTTQARLQIDAGERLRGEWTARWPKERSTGWPRALEGRLEVSSLSALWPMGPESLAAASGWPGMRIEGRLSTSLDWRDGRVQRLDVQFDDVDLEDPAGRLAVGGFQARVQRTNEGERIDFGFDGATLYRLPFGGAQLSLAGTNGRGTDLELTEPARFPLLDGALRIDRLQFRADGGGPGVTLDAEIEPLSLGLLTERMGWPRFGGRLSGRFPGLQLERDVFRVDGGLDLALFDGSARVEGLSIERPFGPLPALSASLSFDRLDLEPLTSAFDFGAMQGSLSGYLRDVRLLDWQPVAFDAWLYTPRDARRPRRISQRAVDQIASLGGGGAAALSAPLLSLFDDFGYAQVGLGCTLVRSVCTMRGLEEMDSGGYRIVEGRGLPRLDVVGFRRRVDWPVLLAQLEAATRSEGPTTGN